MPSLFARCLGLFLLAASCGTASAAAAQSSRSKPMISAGDSIARRIAAHSAESVFVALRDGDYAGFTVTHPTGLAVSAIRPSGARLRQFWTSAQAADVDPIAFVAEGPGDYAITVVNEGNAAADYSIVFRARVSLDDRTRAAPWRDEVSSPTIEAIRRQVDSGNTNTANFWSRVAKEGTPLVEPLDAGYDLVTFIWRAEGDTRNVYLLGSLGVPQGPKDALHRLGATDIWYLTLKLPKGARFSYRLEPNRSSLPDLEGVSAQADPLHRGKMWDCENGAEKYECRSVAELPEAAAQPWIAKRPGVAAGRIEKRTIHSTLQNLDRGLTVYTPAGYAPGGRPSSLVVLFDGDDYLDSTWNGPTSWDNLIAAKMIPPTVVVMVDNLPGRRLFDLVANPTFGDFMAKELAPWIRAHYNVSPEPSRTVIGGASAGGFGAAYLGLVHPEVFGNVLSMSGAFWWSPEHNGGICAGACADPAGRPAFRNRDATTEPNWIAQLALRQPPSSARFYLAAGTFEFDRDGTAGGLLEETRHLRDILRARNHEVIYQQFVGGHDGLSWPGVMADGLQSLLGRAH
jgi:enterochelin esterase-like enzyme